MRWSRPDGWCSIRAPPHVRHTSRSWLAHVRNLFGYGATFSAAAMPCDDTDRIEIQVIVDVLDTIDARLRARERNGWRLTVPALTSTPLSYTR